MNTRAPAVKMRVCFFFFVLGGCLQAQRENRKKEDKARVVLQPQPPFHLQGQTTYARSSNSPALPVSHTPIILRLTDSPSPTHTLNPPLPLHNPIYQPQSHFTPSNLAKLRVHGQRAPRDGHAV